jgi:serine phosphatase RsbU (regulator of sigma subunit)
LKREAAVINAGMKAPLVKSDGKVIIMDRQGYGLPLGAYPDSVYKEESIQLGTGDVMLIFSDGVTEARNKSREFYGDRRLQRLLQSIETSSASSVEIQDRIMNDIQNFTENSQQEDDITLIVIKAL